MGGPLSRLFPFWSLANSARPWTACGGWPFGPVICHHRGDWSVTACISASCIQPLPSSTMASLRSPCSVKGSGLSPRGLTPAPNCFSTASNSPAVAVRFFGRRYAPVLRRRDEGAKPGRAVDLEVWASSSRPAPASIAVEVRVRHRNSCTRALAGAKDQFGRRSEHQAGAERQGASPATRATAQFPWLAIQIDPRGRIVAERPVEFVLRDSSTAAG